jgi:phage baseplate assembly protein V
MSYDHDRRIANLIRVGVIAQLDETHADGPRVTVDLGDVVTTWLPWLTLRAGEDRAWWAPEPGEQVLVLSPSGELAQGFVLAGIPSDLYPANGDRKTLRRTTFKDGTVVEYDREAHQLKVDASASNGAVVVEVGTGSVTINCATATVNATTSAHLTTPQATVTASGNVTLDTPTVHCTHNLQVDGAVTAAGNVTSSGTVQGATVKTAGGIDLATHHHSDPQGGTTGSAA